MAKPRQKYPVFVKPLGMKEGHSLVNMPKGSLFDGKNVYLDPYGRRRKRRGCIPYFSAGSQIENIFDYTTSAGTQRVMVRYGTSLSYKSGTGVASALKTGLTASNRMSMCKYYDKWYGSSTADGLWKYDSATGTFDRARLQPPGSAHTYTQAAGASGFTAAQVYKYYYTYYNSVTAWESNPFGAKPLPPLQQFWSM